MGLPNVAYLVTYTWANPILDPLEKQALVPLFAETPLELGMDTRLEEVLQRLRADARYPALFRAAFPDDKDPLESLTDLDFVNEPRLSDPFAR